MTAVLDGSRDGGMPPPPPTSLSVSPISNSIQCPSIGKDRHGTPSDYNPNGPCSVGRLQAAFDPLLDKAMELHSDPAGKEGVKKGLHVLYYKLGAGELPGSVQEKLVRFVTCIEKRNTTEANRVREDIIRTTTTGWVEGGTWQWCLKHMVTAAEGEVPTAIDEGAAQTAANQEVSPEISHVMDVFTSLLAVERVTGNAKKCDDIGKRLDDLFAALRDGFVNASTCEQLVLIANALEQKDTKAAQKCLQDIAKNDFQNTKSWLPAVRQLCR